MPPSRKESAETDTKKTSTLSESAHRDIINKDRLSEYFDGYLIRTAPFEGSVSSEFLYKRAERLAAAVHLITAHIREGETLREEARKESLLLLQHALQVYAELRTDNSENVREMQRVVRKLISLVRILGVTGRISPQNTQILVEALDELGHFPNTVRKTSLAEAVALTRNDLIPRPDFETKGPLPTIGNRSPLAKGTTRLHPSTVKDSHVKNVSPRKDSQADLRTARVMDLLRGGIRLGIKDIVSNLSEYSEKMVQRNLASLVLKGRVRKIGEKRWSKYELVS